MSLTTLRTPTPQDLDKLFSTAFDQELLVLDPPVGTCFGQQFISIYADTGVLIGMATTYNPDGSHIEVGIRIWDRSYWGRGYGTDVLNQLASLIFTNMPAVEVIAAKTPISNIRARKCYAKCGFHEDSLGWLEGVFMVWMSRGREVIV